MKIGEFDAGRFMLAPMARVTDAAFRLLCRESGAGFTVSEMVSASGIAQGNKRTLALMFRFERENPFSMQLYGNSPEKFAVAAAAIEKGGLAEIIDLNFGCPMKKVVGRGGGGSMMRDPAGQAAIVMAVKKACSLPVTAKIRSGIGGRVTATECALALQDAGCDAVAVHPRLVEQGYSGSADWSVIARVRENLSIPVIGNGDVRSASDAEAMIRTTGCDAVMIGRGARGNPGIFGELAEGTCGRGLPDSEIAGANRQGADETCTENLAETSAFISNLRAAGITVANGVTESIAAATAQKYAARMQYFYRYVDIFMSIPQAFRPGFNHFRAQAQRFTLGARCAAGLRKRLVFAKDMQSLMDIMAEIEDGN
ncbi:MAG: hypothetical protein CVT48_00620 [Thermoplasmata archaeon HGW-Thermoplasmata-1]|nr:MAG: hypothetical protein CVT48_00620 [Thermoplasmata archaeon HGW-Thermoplasmata-1]